MGPLGEQSNSLKVASELQQSGSVAALADTSLSEALTTLRKRKWLLLAAALAGAAYGAYRGYTQPRLFTSTGTIQVHNGASAAYKLTEDYGDDSMTKMYTEVTILQSESLLYNVAKQMNLQNNPDFNGVPPNSHLSIDDPLVRAGVVGNLQGGLKVALLPRTEIISISYTSLNPKLSADIVNQVVDTYMQRSFRTPAEATQRVSDWLSLQLDPLKAEVQAEQRRVMELQQKLGTLGYDSKNNQLSSSLDDLLKAVGTAKVARITAESRYHMVENMDEATVGGSIEMTPGTAPGQLASLRSLIAVAQANYESLLSGGPEGGFGPNNPKALAAKASIDELKAKLKTEQDRMLLQSKESYLAAQAVENKTQQELDTKKDEAYKQGNDLVELTLRQREFDQNRALYDGLQQKLQTAKLQAGLDASEVDRIDWALPAVAPTLSPTRMMVITDTVFFLLGAIVLSFLLDSLDTKLTNITDIERVTELPSLALIPRTKRLTSEQAATLTTAQRNITVLNQPKSQLAESFRALRTSLLLATTGHPPKYILVTSATPSEGKTTVASNLASVMAQGDSRVLLIDADLRRPTLHHRFGIEGKVGLTNVLAGTSQLSEAVQRLAEVPNLDLLCSGPIPPFPTEMLSSDAMRELLEKVGGIYTHVLIDSPPVISVTDGVVLARMMDEVVLVVRYGKSSKHVIRRARDLLVRAGAPMAGLVINSVDIGSPDYYGAYGYSGYSYGTAEASSWETTTTSGREKKQK